jgi:sugar phosphate permease
MISQSLHPLESSSLAIIATLRIGAKVFFPAMLLSLMAREIALASEPDNAAGCGTLMRFFLRNYGLHLS